MKKTIIALFLCISTSVFSQSTDFFELTKAMKCTATDKLMSHLASEFGEKLTWAGKETRTGTYLSLFKNELTGTWTMIQYDGRTGCILGAGESGTPI